MLKRLFAKQPAKTGRKLSKYLDTGFHGDRYLGTLAFHCIQAAEQFIETGTNVGSTLSYVARNFPDRPLYSCEPDLTAYEFAMSKVKDFANVHLYHQISPDFLIERVKQDPAMVTRDTVFWLDAHGYGFQWPLKAEIDFITQNFTKAYIFIDDFQVPGLDCFKWDHYNGQICNFEFIKDEIKPELDYSLYYPNYTEQTSTHHQLTGWGLIEYGHPDKLQFPLELEAKIRRTT